MKFQQIIPEFLTEPYGFILENYKNMASVFIYFHEYELETHYAP